jgi:hypothetical protein
MTLLRRAPREVYRVYGEEEFFALAARDERFEPSAGTVKRRRHRAAGATLLLAATGAVGGLIALNSLSAVTGARRRAGAGLLTATRSLASSRAPRAEVWSEAPSAGGSRRARLREQRGAWRAGRLSVVSGMSTRRPVRTGQPARAVPRASASERAAAGGGRTRSPQMAVAALAQPMQVTASAAAAPPQRSGQSEFGFER